jgi:hypothetical protein
VPPRDERVSELRFTLVFNMVRILPSRLDGRAIAGAASPGTNGRRLAFSVRARSSRCVAYSEP